MTQTVDGQVAEKPVLVNELSGKPTPEGWREIAKRFQKPMSSRQRRGPAGMTFEYITARQVQDRLDAVVGPGNWQTAFVVLDKERAIVECTLSVFDVCKADVGFCNNPEKPEAEAMKSAYSDALKRAAVHFGIGRWLYEDDD
jgi:hypothetical protein